MCDVCSRGERETNMARLMVDAFELLVLLAFLAAVWQSSAAVAALRVAGG
jgi:hypothetical protein